jgi:primosomal protein N' (replication factor Y)
MQISGRAGRGDLPGNVILQTLSPESHAIRKVAQHDYEGFMNVELAEREAMGYPPFGRMLMLRLSGARQEAVREAADETARELSRLLAGQGIRILGPAPSPIPRIKRRFHYQILLLAPPRFPFGEGFPELLRSLREKIRKGGIRLEADVDPYQMMV